MIEAVESERVNVWRNVRGRNERTLIAVGDFSCVVVLDEREDYVLLWTAFYVEREHRRKKLTKEYEMWKANAKNG
jgi:type II secretory pathway component PulM